MLTPEQVIHDRPRAQVGRVEVAADETIMRKVSKHVLGKDGLHVVEFLKKLMAHPHPHLLVPIAVNGSEGEVLVEDYPDLTGREKLDTAGPGMRGEVARSGTVDRVVDFMSRLSDGIHFMHANGFVHRDIRRQNTFVEETGDRVIPIVFDYGAVARPHFMEHGLPWGDRETPPEEFAGGVMIDGRHDVYQLGWMLRELTHFEGGLGPWKPVHDAVEPLVGVIECSTGPIEGRYPDAGEFRQELLAAAG